MLGNHPDKQLVQFTLHGICIGFHTGFTKPLSSLKAATRNLEGAQEHPDVVTDYLSTEVSLGHVAGPFPPQAIPQVHISHFGVIPKGNTVKWRLVVDLSHPRGHSVNDGIPKSLCSLKYVTIDEAIQGILQLGWGALLAKIDIKSTFRPLPVHPADRHMLGMQWRMAHTLTLASPLVYGRPPSSSTICLSLDCQREQCIFFDPLPGRFLNYGTPIFFMLPIQPGYNYQNLQLFRCPTCLRKDCRSVNHLAFPGY